jgi:hypothetical protein
MIFGLFLDGWAHEAQKPETFFSPWHGVLYSGFVAAVAWFAWDGRRRGSTATGPGDRWLTAGLVVFVTGAVGDGIWHEVFGIEVDLEALLSPTHLLLFIGGFLMVTQPLRAALADATEARPSWSQWWPQAATLTLATALVSFFSMYLSAHQGVGSGPYESEDEQAFGIAAVLATNLILMVPTVVTLRRWDPPRGALVVLFGTVAVLMSGLHGFDGAEFVFAPILGGAAIEVLRRLRGGALPAVAVVAGGSFVLWGTSFVLVEVTRGLAWPVDLWGGAIVLATASSALLAAVVSTPSRPSIG